ncbi:MAG TPA: c-type cytochrome [Burkholderiales bacterium]|nr:c-type cytochrome [Burkholderiales bacterium]
MSEHHPHDAHSTFIKTPKQLLVVVILSFVIPIVLISIIAGLATRSVSPGATVLSEEAIAKRLKPVGQVVVAEGSDVPGQKTGKQIVDSVCSACHATGALNAPKIGDAAVWGPLIKQGHEHLTEMAIKGIRAMPPRGGNPALTDDELARAVAYMANQAGAKFTEPAVKTAPAQTAAAPAAAAPAPAAAGAPPSAPAAGAAAGGSDKGKAIFDANCAACHGTGVAGAPKLGDKAAWAPRLKQGLDTLHEHALKGKGAMPPKGGNMSLSDADVMAAVDYLASQGK